MKYIKTILANTDNSTINYDVTGFIYENSMYEVLGLRFEKSVTYVYIFNGNHLKS